MSEYTPTNSEVREQFARGARGGYGGSAEAGAHRQVAAQSKFDRWLAEVERAAAARALDLAADEIESRRNVPGLVHLDVRYGGYYTGIRSGMESDSKALRARAAEIREKKSE